MRLTIAINTCSLRQISTNQHYKCTLPKYTCTLLGALALTITSLSLPHLIPMSDGGVIMTQLTQEVDGFAGENDLVGLVHRKEGRYHGTTQTVFVVPQTLVLHCWVTCHKELKQWKIATFNNIVDKILCLSIPQ